MQLRCTIAQKEKEKKGGSAVKELTSGRPHRERERERSTRRGGREGEQAARVAHLYMETHIRKCRWRPRWRKGGEEYMAEEAGTSVRLGL